jgi:phospholipase/lecithinase/hemolysin
MTIKLRVVPIALIAFGVMLPSANASIDTIYAFGDSLSDAGNIFAGTHGLIPPTPPYYNGEFSNGAVWVQDLANQLGLGPLGPSLLGGTDYAYGSGETGPLSFNISDPRTDILGPVGQLAQFESTHATADPGALYTIWIGSNDLADLAATGNPALFAGGIAAITNNIDTTVTDLAALGARNFLVLNVPNLGLTPLAATEGAQFALSQLALGLDQAMAATLPGVAAFDGVNLKLLNTYALLDNIVTSPSSFGLTNVTDSCLNTSVTPATVCSDPNQYLFWDDQHPTAAGHLLVADEARAAVTPEPGYISLVGVGLVGLAFGWRKSRRAGRAA